VNTLPPHIFGGTLVQIDGKLNVVDSVLQIQPTVLRSSSTGLLNISALGRCEMKLTALDENEFHGLSFTTSFSTTIVKTDSDSSNAQSTMYSSRELTTASYMPVSILNGGVFMLHSGTLKLNGGYISYGTSHLMIAKGASMHFAYQSLISEDEQQLITDGISAALQHPSFPSYILNGIELVNNGQMNVHAGHMLITSPLKQDGGGQLRGVNSSLMTFQTTSTTDEKDMNIFYQCDPQNGGMNCPSVHVTKLILMSGVLRFSANSIVQVDKLVNHGASLLMGDASTLTINNYITQDTDNAILYLSTDASIMSSRNSNSTMNECNFQRGNITCCGGSSITCSHVTMGDGVNLKFMNASSSASVISIHGDLTMSNTTHTILEMHSVEDIPLIHVTGSMEIGGGDLLLTGSLLTNDTMTMSNDNEVISNVLLQCDGTISGEFRSNTTTFTDNEWYVFTSQEANAIMMQRMLSSQARKHNKKKKSGGISLHSYHLASTYILASIVATFVVVLI
jgi:hypothetical protein